jgi:DNA-binding NtrC family response regulator
MKRLSLMEQALGSLDRTVLAVTGRSQAREALNRHLISVIITSPVMADGRWQDILGDLALLPLAANTIVFAAYRDEVSRSEVLHLGGFGLVREPLDTHNLRWLVDLAVEDWTHRYEQMRTRVRVAGDAAVVIPERYASSHEAFEAVPLGCGEPICGEQHMQPQISEHPHILVIDDERTILELVSRILEPEGLEIRTAEDGNQALVVAGNDPEIRLAILDWNLPGMRGERVFDELTAVRPFIKVIVVSGSSQAEVERAFLGRKVAQFLPKPFKTQTLVAAVRSALAA